MVVDVGGWVRVPSAWRHGAMGQLEQKLHEHCRDLLDSGEKREMTAFCPRCGGTLAAFSQECPACGYDLREDPGARPGLSGAADSWGYELADALLLVCACLAALGAAFAAAAVVMLLVRGAFWGAGGAMVGGVHSLGMLVVFLRVRSIRGLLE